MVEELDTERFYFSFPGNGDFTATVAVILEATKTGRSLNTPGRGKQPYQHKAEEG